MTIAGRTALLVLAQGLLGIPLSTAAAATDTAELARCTAIAVADARLACYDTLARRTAAGNMPSPDHATAAARPAMAVPAVPPALAVQAVPPTQGVSAAQAAPSPADAERGFGLSASQLHTAPQGPQAIQAHIAQVVEDQNRRSYVVLDNGQTWVSTEGEMILDSGEAVTIGRAALGSFMLTSAQSNHSYHVRRIR